MSHLRRRKLGAEVDPQTVDRAVQREEVVVALADPELFRARGVVEPADRGERRDQGAIKVELEGGGAVARAGLGDDDVVPVAVIDVLAVPAGAESAASAGV